MRKIETRHHSDSFYVATIFPEEKVADLLETMEGMANLLEAGQMVPMRVPPTSRVYAFESQKEPNLEELRTYAYELAERFKKACHILV